jgi:cytochrome P450
VKNHNFPPGYTFLQTYKRALAVVRNPLQVMNESVIRFGESYSVYSGLTSRMILTQDPEFIEYILKKNHRNYNKSRMVTEKLGRFIGNGLLTSNGAYWLRQRRLIQPGFHQQKIQSLYGIMKKTIDDFLLKLPTGDRVDIYPHMNRLAFEVVINTLFDVKIPVSAIDELSRFISEVQEFIIRDIRQSYRSWWFVLTGEVEKNMKKAQRARDILREIIHQRKVSGKKFNDLLDMLLDARYEDTGEPMTEEQILDEILILFIAGHETTGNALTWTLYLLANHPAELVKLRRTTTDLNIQASVTHPDLEAVINESMRLYPPAWVSDRVALEDDSFKDFSYPKGTIIALYYYGLHRNERYWKDAISFVPERFKDWSADKEKTKAFFPFGAGPRMCIGNNFAMAEMALFLQAFIHTFDLKPTNAVPKMNPLVTLRPEGVLLGNSRRRS